MRIKNLDSGPCQLYRHFNASGELLYVGIALSTLCRLAQHRAQSKWFDQIARVDIQTFPSRPAAVSAERLAIKTEKPRHNIFYNPDLTSGTSDVPKPDFKLNKIKRDEIYGSIEAARFLQLKSDELTELICRGKIKITLIDAVDKIIKFTGQQILDYAERCGRTVA